MLIKVVIKKEGKTYQTVGYIKWTEHPDNKGNWVRDLTILSESFKDFPEEFSFAPATIEQITIHLKPDP